MDVAAFARRFGLQFAGNRLSRNGGSVDVPNTFDLSCPESRNTAFSTCLGVRLGLDQRSATTLDGDLIQRLLPRAAVLLASEVADCEPATRPWIDGLPFDIVFLRETGRLTILASKGDVDDATADAARRALFYRAYRLRPARSEVLGSGTLKTYRTTGGLASSVATLLPDFDLDAARARGAAAIPDYDTLLVWQPENESRVGSDLRRAVTQLVRETDTPFSRRLLQLRPSNVVAGETAGAAAEFGST